MSASMRNAIQRRPHRERAQPHERRHLGILEKHKDYSLRAKDYNKKKAHLKALRLKASERNEDEFYFGMHSRKARLRHRRGVRADGGQRGAEGGDGASAEGRDGGGSAAAADGAVSSVPTKIIFAEGVEEREEMLRANVGTGAPALDEDDLGAFGEDDRALEESDEGGAGPQGARLASRSLRKVEAYLEVQQAKMAKTATSGGSTRKGKKLMVRKRKK
ncbi:unnamed protein product [Parascedosporium putredinis]|uniref:U3 small nucleolar RNA-associated protein 11 n=1 Tax=Parascedosporium putredinis TaxID=1442378 RepID=A0A9P1MET4_9PEZI|nr:unnamed protein product [Parascedosporium putredinis]CAI8002130.1 unnamed protein product [Parascedosporium putredinis]